MSAPGSGAATHAGGLPGDGAIATMTREMVTVPRLQTGQNLRRVGASATVQMLEKRRNAAVDEVGKAFVAGLYPEHPCHARSVHSGSSALRSVPTNARDDHGTARAQQISVQLIAVASKLKDFILILTVAGPSIAVSS